MFIRVGVALDDAAPGQGVKSVDEHPDAYDRHQPVAGAAQMLPQFGETDVEGEEHHHHAHYAGDEEDVVKSLFRHISLLLAGLQGNRSLQSHSVQFVSNLLAETLVTVFHIHIQQSHAEYLPYEVHGRYVCQTEDEEPHGAEVEC